MFSLTNGRTAMEKLMETLQQKKVLVISILCFLVVVPLAFFWFAKGWGIPGRPPNMYIRDEIEVLPESLEVTIIQKNDDLFDETGGEIAIVTVGSVGSRSIEDYAEKTFNKWKLGSAERNNGVLLVLLVDGNDYRMCVQLGDGIPQGTAVSIIKAAENAELQFAAGRYGDGVRGFFRTAWQTIWDTPPSSYYHAEKEAPAKGKIGFGSVLYVVFILGIIVLILKAVMNFFGVGNDSAEHTVHRAVNLPPKDDKPHVPSSSPSSSDPPVVSVSEALSERSSKDTSQKSCLSDNDSSRSSFFNSESEEQAAVTFSFQLGGSSHKDHSVSSHSGSFTRGGSSASGFSRGGSSGGFHRGGSASRGGFSSGGRSRGGGAGRR